MKNGIAKTIAAITRKFHPRGTQRILKWLFNPKNFRIKDVIKYDRDLFINIDTSSYVEWELFFRGYYEEKSINIIKKILQQGAVAFDIGANIGSHTLIMGKLVGDSGKVFAFDPHPEICKKLVDNINLNNFKNAKVFQLALSDKIGEMTLFSHNKTALDQGTSSLYALDNLQNKFKVSVSKIDKVFGDEGLDRLDFIKIDTRGSDFPIIIGGSESIKKFTPYILFEYNRGNWKYSDSTWNDAKNFFDQNKYFLYLIDESGLSPIKEKPVFETSHNILAVPANKLTQLKL